MQSSSNKIFKLSLRLDEWSGQQKEEVTDREEILSDLHHFNDAVLYMERSVTVHLQAMFRSTDVWTQLYVT